MANKKEEFEGGGIILKRKLLKENWLKRKLLKENRLKRKLLKEN